MAGQQNPQNMWFYDKNWLTDLLLKFVSQYNVCFQPAFGQEVDEGFTEGRLDSDPPTPPDEDPTFPGRVQLIVTLLNASW